MAVPTYDDLLEHHSIEKSIMKRTFDDEDIREFSLTLDMWEILAKFLRIPNSDISNIKSHGDAVEQKIKMLDSTLYVKFLAQFLQYIYIKGTLPSNCYVEGLLIKPSMCIRSL